MAPPDPSTAFATGAFVDGWVLDWPVGEGRQGVVLRCHRAEDDHVVAVLKTALTPDAFDALEREATALEAVSHPAFPALLGRGERGGAPYLVMEHVGGRSLASQAGRARTPDMVASIVVQLADALAALHAVGLAHGDVKPANVRLHGDQVRVLDLGASTSVSEPRGTAGTAAYAPLEPAEDRRSDDVFAVGVIAWELLTGRAAFHGAEPRPRGALDPGEAVEEPLGSLIRACTDEREAVRPTARALARALTPLVPAHTPASLASGTWVDGPAQDEPSGAVLPRAGERVGRYVLREVLGHGGMGVVHRAWDEELRRDVAVKLTLPGRADAERARREARALAQVAHPNIVQVLDTGLHATGAWFAMELVEGEDLGAFVRERGVLPVRQAVTWARDLARALAHAHERGVVHRDLKPSNVLLDGEQPRLVDFGLAALDAGTVVELTTAGAVLGTPAFMAPEQAAGDPVSPAVDQYGLCAVLFHMLVGRAPFEASHPAALLREVMEGTLPDVHALRAEVPREIGWVVARGMSREAGHRYPSMEALAEDLDAWLDDRPVSAGPEPLGRKVRRAVRRHRRALLAGGGTALGLGVLALVVWLGGQQLAAWQESVRQAEASERLQAIQARAASVPDAEADELYAAFLQLEDHADTTARVRAWIARAERVAGSDPELATTWLARAYEEARTEVGQRAALLALFDAFARQGRWADRAAVAERIRQRLPDWREDPDLVRAVTRGRASAGLPALRPGDPASPIDRFRRGTRLGPIARKSRQFPAVLDEDGDGREELYLRGDDGGERVFVGDDGQVRRLPSEQTDLRFPTWIEVDEEVLVIEQVRMGAQHSMLYRVGAEGPELVRELPDSMRASGVGDLDEDGLDELYLGGLDDLWRMERTADGGWTEPVLAFDGSRFSQVNAVLVEDFDGDGTLEIITTHGAWSSFDVRLSVLGGTTPLRTVSRHRVGQAFSAVAFDLHGADRRAVAVFKTNAYGSRMAFPSGDPYGPPRGIYVYGVQDGVLDPIQRVDSAHELVRASAPDLDGDGVQEFVAEADYRHLLVWTQRDDARIDPDPDALIDWTPGTTADLDGDGRDEIIAQDMASDGRELWVLGLGDEPVPPRALPPASPPPPAGLPARHREAWMRAEDLAALGLADESAHAFERLATVTTPDASAEAELRAAEVLRVVQDVDPDHLLGMLASASEHPQTRSRALAVWVEIAREAGLDTEALRVVDLLLAEDLPAAERDRWTATRAELGALAQRPVVQLVGPELLRLRAAHPHAVRADRDGLFLEAGNLREPILVGEAVWDGGPVDIRLDLQLDRLEWSSLFQVDVLDAQGRRVARVRQESRGGGRITHVLTDPPGEVAYRRTLERASEPLAVSLRARFEEGQAVTSWQEIDGVRRRDAHAAGPDAPEPPAPGPVRIEVRMSSTMEAPILQRLRLRHLEVAGLRLTESPAASPEQAALQDLAAFRPQQALDRVGPAGDPVLRAIALDDLGRRGEAVEALRDAALGAEALDLWASMRPGLVRAVTAEADWLPRLWRAREVAMHQHRQDPGTRALLFDQAGLPSVPPADPDELYAVGRLLLVRVRALLADGQTGPAYAHARWVADHAAALPDPLQRGRLAGPASLLLARLAARRGERAEAMRHALAAIEHSEMPELSADTVLSDPDLVDLHELPAWREVERASGALPVGVFDGLAGDGRP